MTNPTRSALMIRWGRAISAARRSRGLTQPQAATALGVEVWTLRAWEQGRRACPRTTREQVVLAFGADPLDLDTDTDHCPECGRSFAETSHSTRSKP
jgi:transcriptional regulator with XRE-family HTH domain